VLVDYTQTFPSFTARCARSDPVSIAPCLLRTSDPSRTIFRSGRRQFLYKSPH
jgi:hypothetical protein